MSFANKGADSADTAKLRKEYQGLAAKCREASYNNATEKDKGRAEKAKAFEKMQSSIIQERRDNLSDLHKVLIQQGRLKTPEQMAELRAAANPGKSDKE